MTYYGIIQNGDNLYHYGIKGQKWGARRYQNLDGSLTSAGRTEKNSYNGDSSGSGTSKGTGGKHGDYLSTEDKTYLTALAVGVGVVLARKGIQKLAVRSVIKDAKKTRVDEVLEQKSGLYLKKNQNATEEDDMNAVNPSYEVGGKEAHNNCMLCTATYDMRRRGYDVIAGEEKNGLYASDYGKYYKDLKHTDVVIGDKQCVDTFVLNKDSGWDKKEQDYIWNNSGKQVYVNEDASGSAKNLTFYDLKQKSTQVASGCVEAAKSMPDQRGNLMITSAFGGHSMAYEIKSGELHIYDCQTADHTSGSAAANYLSSQYAFMASFTRLDNKEANIEAMKKDSIIR